MATALVTGEVSDTDCSVCHEAFKEPKILPCGHVVCRPCLLSWLRTQPEAGCPFCRCAVLEKGGQPGSMEDEVGALPTDLALAELVEARALLDKDHVCCVCDDVAATALCLHCGDMLCATCRKAHEKMTTTKHHKVQDLSSLTPDLLATDRPSPCSNHPAEAYKMFCPTHGINICFQCATTKHRSCPEIKDLGEKTEEARAALVQMAASLSDTEQELREAIQQLDRHVLETKERVQAAIITIQKTCDQLESSVKSCRDRMSDLARSAGTDIQDRARAAITKLQGRKSKVGLHSVVVTRAEQSKAHATVCEMSAVMETRVQQLDCGVTLPASDVMATLDFSIDGGVVSTVEKALAEFGRVILAPAQHLAVRQTQDFTFSDNHGAGVTLSADRRTATRTGGYLGCGLVVSSEPLAANVLYEVRLDQRWTDAWLPVGVLTGSPDSVYLTRAWSGGLRPVTAVSTSGVTRSGTTGWDDHPLSSAIEGLRQGDRVGVSVDTSRRPHLHVNGADLGVFDDTPVPEQCHALLDMIDCYQDGIQMTALTPTPLTR